MRDVNKDFWNNRIDFGPGIWFRPVLHFGFKFFIEWLQGYYFDVKGKYYNPHPKQYNDRRMGIIFWYGW
jgi:hypothetical protein